MKQFGFKCVFTTRIVTVIFMVLFAILSACNSSRENKYGVERLGFDVVDSLIGSALMVETANKAVCPPVSFTVIPDSLLVVLKQKQKLATDDFAEIKLIQMFIDSLNNSGLIVLEIPGLRFANDMYDYISKYTDNLNKYYGKENIKTGEYVVNDVLVKNYLVTDDRYIRFQLLCLSDSSSALELQYYASKENYPDLLKSIESSIGTIQLIKKED